MLVHKPEGGHLVATYTAITELVYTALRSVSVPTETPTQRTHALRLRSQSLSR